MYKKQVFKVGSFANRKIELYLPARSEEHSGGHSLCGCGGTGRHARLRNG